MNVSVLIPWRTDHAERARVFAYVMDLWGKLPLQVVVGADASPDTPFNVSRAFNDAAAHADGDVFVLFGADQLPDLDAIAAAAKVAGDNDSWAPLFAATGAYRELDTQLIVGHGADPTRYNFAQFAPFCTGILAVSRGAWARVNGMDERFFGWGCEDVALRMALETIEGPSSYTPTGTLCCLWHRSAPRDRFDANAAMIGAYETAVAAGPQAMRELVAGNGHAAFEMPT